MYATVTQQQTSYRGCTTVFGCAQCAAEKNAQARPLMPRQNPRVCAKPHECGQVRTSVDTRQKTRSKFVTNNIARTTPHSTQHAPRHATRHATARHTARRAARHTAHTLMPQFVGLACYGAAVRARNTVTKGTHIVRSANDQTRDVSDLERLQSPQQQEIVQERSNKEGAYI